MSVRVSVIKTGRPLSAIKWSTRDLMKEVGLLARERIVRRTIAGRDQNDNAFQPYSAAYAFKKAREVGSASVNLQLSGGMLNALTIIELTDKTVTLGFA